MISLLSFFSFILFCKILLCNLLAAWFSVWHPLRNVPVQTVKPNSNEWMGCRYRHDHSRICIVSVCAYGKLLRKKIKRLQKKPNQMVTLNKKKDEWNFNVLGHVSFRGIVLLVLLQMCGLV